MLRIVAGLCLVLGSWSTVKSQCYKSESESFSLDGPYNKYQQKSTWIDANVMFEQYNLCLSDSTREDFIEHKTAFYKTFCEKGYGDSADLRANEYLKPFGSSLDVIEMEKFPPPPNPGGDEVRVSMYIDNDNDGIPNYKDEAYALRLNELQGGMVNALASFMANRFKEEATSMALKSLFKRMSDEDSVLVSALFPRTFIYVTNLMKEGSYYSGDLLQMRQIIAMDLQKMDQAFEEHQEAIFPTFKEHQKELEVFNLARYILSQNQAISAKGLLAHLPRYAIDSSRRLTNWLDFTNMISAGLTSHEDSDKWIDVNKVLSIDSLFKSEETTIFYGLFYEQLAAAPDVQIFLGHRSQQEINQTMYRILKPFQSQTFEFVPFKVDSASIVNNVKVANETLNFLRQLMHGMIVQDNFQYNPELLEVANNTLELTRAFRLGNYQEALNIMSVYYLDYLGGSLKNLHSVSFLIQFANASSMKELQYLIESYALPIGASSIKRHSAFNVSLNGYVGITGGYETAYGTERKQNGWNVGLSAPIGISTTFANGRLTGFASVLDLGNLVNQRLNNNQTDYPELTFEQFLSLGGGLYYNVKSNPLTFGIQYNYIPKLRTMTYEANSVTITETNRNVSRFNASILMDIPLITIFNRK